MNDLLQETRAPSDPVPTDTALRVLSLKLMEWVIGEPVQKILAEYTTISEKTWSKGGPKSPIKWERADREIIENGRRQWLDNGHTEQEFDEWVSRFPVATNEEPYLFTTLILLFSRNVPETLKVANAMDELSHALTRAKRQEDFSLFKAALLDGELLSPLYFSYTDAELRGKMHAKLFLETKESNDWSDFNDEIIKAITSNLLFSMLACWDVEFSKSYFSKYKPFPLFACLMLRPTHDLRQNPEFGRDGLHRPIRNLIDQMAFIGFYIRHRKWPSPRIKVADMQAWLEASNPPVSSQKLWNWRSGRDSFDLDDFLTVWKAFLNIRDDTIPAPPPPFPLYVAAKVWENLLYQWNPKKKSGKLFISQPHYLFWWEFQRNRLMANTSSQEKKRWPACFRNQSSWIGSKSPDSTRSSQSSGRSSNPRDSQ